MKPDDKAKDPSSMVEGAELLGHSYDGIQEYDNPLPGWWLWIFWITIAITPLYILHYHFGEGAGVQASYDAERAEWSAAEAARAMESGVVSEETLAALTKDAATLAAGEALFKTNCVACHGDKGEGKIGPNLTDAYWIHGGTLVDIHRTINDGVPDKGMLAWGKTLSPDDVRRITAYVGSRRGLDVPGLAPQGQKVGM